MVTALNGVQSNWVMSRVGGEDRDCGALGQSVDCRLVGVGIRLIVGGE